MREFKDKVGVITGAGSGIGRELALGLSRLGCRLSLSDINTNSLAETQSMIRAMGGEVVTEVFDVSDRKAFYSFAAHTINRYGSVDLMVNNAGMALDAIGVSQLDISDFEWIMGINFWGVVYGTKAFLPYLKRSKEGMLINISSIFGITGIGGQTPYCTTKFAVRGFTESLRMELYTEAPHLTVSCVHPGGIKTNIARNSKKALNNEVTDSEKEKRLKEFEEKALIMPPAKAAEVIIEGIRKRKERIVIGKDARRMDLLARLWPSGYSRMIFKTLSKEGLLD